MHYTANKSTRGIQKTDIVWMGILAVATLILLYVGGKFYQYIDVITFHVPWSYQLDAHGFLSYSAQAGLVEAGVLDYPPGFPSILWLLHPLINWANTTQSLDWLMLFLKCIPILANTCICIAIYMFLRKKSISFAMICSALWLCNPAAIFNCAFWGQTNTILMLWILLCFWMFYRRRPVFACIFFALGCLFKLQMLFFAPVVLFELLFHYPVKKWFQSVFISLAVFFAGWLPFLIGAGSISPLFQIYFGGFDKYQHITLNASNIYNLTPELFNAKEVSTPVVADLSLNQVSSVVLIVIVLTLLAFYIAMHYKKIYIEPVVPAMLYFNLIFMLTTKQHEQYQLPTVVLAMICFMLYKKRSFLIIYISSALISFLNTAAVLFSKGMYGGVGSDWLPGILAPHLNTFLLILSICNCILLVFMIIVFVYTVKTQKQKYAKGIKIRVHS